MLQALGVIDAAESTRDIELELAELCSAYGFPHFWLVQQPKPNEDIMGLVLLGRFPEGWPETYIRKKYIIIDPTLRHLAKAERGFRWSEAVAALSHDTHARRVDRMMTDARRHGLHDGYLFPVHGRRGVLGTFTICGPLVDLEPVDVALFESLSKLVFWRVLELEKPQVHATMAAKLDVKLTHREMEALHYLSDGLTSPEIAAVLKISNHTVDWYMNGIQQKLSAKNRHHAVSIAFRLGLIS